MKDIFYTFGIPVVISTDQGSEFKTRMNSALTEQLGSKHRLMSCFHPQANWLDKRFNQTLIQCFLKYLSRKEDWDIHLQAAVHAYNTAVQDLKVHTFWSNVWWTASTPHCICNISCLWTVPLIGYLEKKDICPVPLRVMNRKYHNALLCSFHIKWSECHGFVHFANITASLMGLHLHTGLFISTNSTTPLMSDIYLAPHTPQIRVYIVTPLSLAHSLKMMPVLYRCRNIGVIFVHSG